MTARAWVALWTVYILWGSTYLGIELAGETIPPIFAAGVRFTSVGVLLCTWLLLRHGTTPFRLGWVTAGSTVLCGVLLIGANALLFAAERTAARWLRSRSTPQSTVEPAVTQPSLNGVVPYGARARCRAGRPPT